MRYVYAHKVERNKDYVKIGYTTRPVKERHDQWSFDCNQRGQRAVLRLRLGYLNYATAQSGLRYVPLVKLWV
jgi:hypothetical protein